MAPMVAKTIKSEVAALTELKQVLESRACIGGTGHP